MFSEVSFVTIAKSKQYKSGKHSKGEAWWAAYDHCSTPETTSLHPWMYCLICLSRSAWPVSTGTRFSASSRILRASHTSLHASSIACCSEHLFSIARTGTMLSIWLTVYQSLVEHEFRIAMKIRTNSLWNDTMSLILIKKWGHTRARDTYERYGQMY